MTIFHLKIELQRKDHGCFYERGNFFSEVYPKLEFAVEEGVRSIRAMIDKEREKATNYKDEPVEVFVSETLTYRFEISEFDPETREMLKPDKKCEFPTEVNWEYDFSGRLINRVEWWHCIGYTRLPGDEQPDAGTRFHLGDLATVTGRKENEGKIYVVAGCPGRRAGPSSAHWENIYRVAYITEDGYFDESCHEHFHESKLKEYAEKVPENSALRVLSDIMAGRKQISDNVRQRLFSGEISLSDKPSWQSLDTLAH